MGLPMSSVSSSASSSRFADHEVGELEQHFLARLGRLMRPASLSECTARAGHGAIDVYLFA